MYTVLVCIVIAYLIAKCKQVRMDRSRCQQHIEEFNKPHAPGFFQGYLHTPDTHFLLTSVL